MKKGDTMLKIYGTTWCSDCRRVKNWLQEHIIAFTDINIENDEKAVEEVLRINKGIQTVPTVVFPNGFVLIEPDIQTLEKKVQELHILTRENYDTR